jgi:mono/diheme cytochrome c family protein
MKRKFVVFTTITLSGLVTALCASPGGPARAAEARRKWEAPASASQQKNPVPAGAQSLAAGRTLYSRECASCHGDGGRGDGKDGRDLDLPPADLSSPAVAGQSDGALFWKITNGRRPMPSYRKDLSDEERWQLVHYLRALNGNASKGGAR